MSFFKWDELAMEQQHEIAQLKARIKELEDAAHRREDEDRRKLLESGKGPPCLEFASGPGTPLPR